MSQPHHAVMTHPRTRNDAPAPQAAWVVKHRPEDFVVTECLSLPLEQHSSGSFTYLGLRKRGFTTFEALERIARVLRIDTPALGFAGLKDEDGITEQTISVPGALSPAQLEALNQALTSEDERFISLYRRGSGPRKLEVAQLHGNAFEITIRNLSLQVARTLSQFQRTSFLFLNYYDSQRFGVAGGPQTTHRIGRRLLDGDLPGALELLAQAATPESPGASQHRGSPREFFLQLSPRVTSFYACAWASYEWNAELSGLVAQIDRQSLAAQRGAAECLFSRSAAALAQLQAEHPQLAYGRYTVKDLQFDRQTSERPTVVQTTLQARAHQEDEAFFGRWKCTVSFFLPLGVYATMALSQLEMALAQAPHNEG